MLQKILEDVQEIRKRRLQYLDKRTMTHFNCTFPIFFQYLLQEILIVNPLLLFNI